MEKRELIKMKIENSTNGFSRVFDFSEAEKGSLGFMDLLGVQNLSPSLFHFTHPEPTTTKTQSFDYCQQALNRPSTPNSSSISKASSDAVNNYQTKTVIDQQEQEQQKTIKQLKAKKTNQKSQRKARFAFMTKSEVDHLEDGYRWRKYGQKAVKNSLFPRGYYRCTSGSCNVKKRVERSFTDPTIVITTYEGKHTHPRPVICRTSTHSGGGSLPTTTLPHYNYHDQHQQPYLHNLPVLNFSCNGTSSAASNAAFIREKRFCTPGPASTLISDHGLLQDILPSHMLKQE